MGRPAKAWQIYIDRRTKKHFVRFRHEGRRFNVATGERDPRAAHAAAARIYAEAVVAGEQRQQRLGEAPRPAMTPTAPFAPVAAQWLSDIEPTIAPNTFRLYRDGYVRCHFLPFFRTLGRLSTVGIEDYISDRLRKVRRETVKKEASVLRRLAKWAYRRGYLTALPEVELPGRRSLGTPASPTRKVAYQVFTAEEIGRIVEQLPEWARTSNRVKASGRERSLFPVRARFIVAWETTLRPSTLDKLRVPDDYQKGGASLSLREEADKARYNRELPLSDAARAALDRVCPDSGLIFGRHDYRNLLQEAAKRASVGPHRAAKISAYDFRHSSLTHYGQVSDNLAGVMYLAGHKQPATTARYLRPQRQAAEEVLRSAAARRGGATPLPVQKPLKPPAARPTERRPRRRR